LRSLIASQEELITQLVLLGWIPYGTYTCSLSTS